MSDAGAHAKVVKPDAQRRAQLTPTRQRCCINGTALEFAPAANKS